jgi:hypothetical protein
VFLWVSLRKSSSIFLILKINEEMRCQYIIVTIYHHLCYAY